MIKEYFKNLKQEKLDAITHCNYCSAQIDRLGDKLYYTADTIILFILCAICISKILDNWIENNVDNEGNVDLNWDSIKNE